MGNQDTTSLIDNLGRNAKAAAVVLSTTKSKKKNEALQEAAKALRNQEHELLAANAVDVEGALAANRPESYIDRLGLSKSRIESMAKALEDIAGFPDPVGRSLGSWTRPNGLLMERIAVPIGVIAMIYESRPNVGSDASALCLKSGNAIILRGGSDSLESTRVIVDCMQMGLLKAGLPAHCIQWVDSPERKMVGQLLRCVEYIDLVIPRGGKGLVSLVQKEARVPTLLHLEGNCHTYVHKDADLDKAIAIVVNAKMRRTGICGATESLIVDRAIAADFLPSLQNALADCELRGDAESVVLDKRIVLASEKDWDTEYLDALLSVKLVADEKEGIAFVAAHSSGHTDAIVTENPEVAENFLQSIDSAVVMHNASTQFSDGGEFGFGAEIGIATGKLHARGPVGLEQLTSYKYIVRGTGQVRPL